MKKENGSMFKCGPSTFEHSEDIKEQNELGRFPSNFIYTGCDEVFDEFDKAGYSKGTNRVGNPFFPRYK